MHVMSVFSQSVRAGLTYQSAGCDKLAGAKSLAISSEADGSTMHN